MDVLAPPFDKRIPDKRIPECSQFHAVEQHVGVSYFFLVAKWAGVIFSYNFSGANPN